MRIASLFLFIVLSAGQVRADGTTHATGDRFRDCPDCPELVYVEPGQFMMGSSPEDTAAAGVPPERAINEHSPARITLARGFAMGRRETTIGEFRRFVAATGYETQAGCFGLQGRAWAMGPAARWDSPGYAVTDDYPAACLTVDDFESYLSWLSEETGERYRLPTEAEWEYMAQLGGGMPPRLWRAEDADACELVNAADRQFTESYDGAWPAFECDDGFKITSPTGEFPANQLGMYDVFGNTAEVTADCFVAGHAGQPADGSARQSKPCGALVFKGGSWAAEPSFLRPAFRVVATRDVRGNGFGMRVLREVDE